MPVVVDVALILIEMHEFALIMVVPTMFLKSFGKPDLAKNKSKVSVAQTSSHVADMVSVTRADYESLVKNSGISSTIAASTTASASTVSHGKSWMLDNGATAHITSTKSVFHTFSSSSLPPVCLADGTFSPITGTGVITPTRDLTLENVLFAPKFLVSLLSISHLTKTHNCSVTFYPSYCVF